MSVNPTEKIVFQPTRAQTSTASAGKITIVGPAYLLACDCPTRISTRFGTQKN